jgi:hypothetical protein
MNENDNLTDGKRMVIDLVFQGAWNAPCGGNVRLNNKQANAKKWIGDYISKHKIQCDEPVDGGGCGLCDYSPNEGSHVKLDDGPYWQLGFNCELEFNRAVGLLSDRLGCQCGNIVENSCLKSVMCVVDLTKDSELSSE